MKNVCRATLVLLLLSISAQAGPVEDLLNEIERQTSELGKTEVRKIMIDIGPLAGKGEGRDVDEVSDLPNGWVLDGDPTFHETYRTGDTSWNGITLLSKGSDLRTAQEYLDKMRSEAEGTVITADGTQYKGRLENELSHARNLVQQFKTGSQAIRYRARVAPQYRDYSAMGVGYSDLKARGCLKGEIWIPIRRVGTPDEWQNLLSLYSSLRSAIAKPRPSWSVAEEISATQWNTPGYADSNNPVIGGKDEFDNFTYPALVKCAGSWMPGRIIKGQNYGIGCYGGQLLTSPEFAVLTSKNHNYGYQAWQGVIPDNAFTGGTDAKTGKTLYFARGKIAGRWVPGKWLAGSPNCWVPYDGKEQLCSEFELLCQSPK